MNPRKGTSLQRGGLSKSAAVHTYRGSHRHRGVLRAGNQDERRGVNLEARAAAIVEMAEEDRDAVAQMDRDDNMTYVIEDDGYSVAFQTIPPGDEGYGLSHEGGEHEVFEGFAEDLSKWTGIRRKDTRSRRDRLKISVEQWNDQMESLVDAYLEYNAQDCNESTDRDRDMAPETKSSQSFQIEVVDLFRRKIQHFLPCDSEKYANVTLVRYGCIGASPLHPTIAITLRTLAVYRSTHRVCPRLSIQAEVRKLCHMHKV
ncbi:hypothetical protein BD410DRAFT_810579 [Rickenella mellea]|uniref:Uncharacterized protein n=1 Tax=Rickenella mellea TaxID=50990 RepID=A0A4Y7PDR4_9AGAM|nr:hypothetical protein BD410DRAFT_810579 [Rickenella mellea]